MTKNNFIPVLIGFSFLIMSNFLIASETHEKLDAWMAFEVHEKLDAWREHILRNGNYGGVENDSEAYQELLDMGPNCLPVLFEAYREEQDIHVLYYYTSLIRAISKFKSFKYSKQVLKKNGYDLECKENTPFLNIELDKKGRPVLSHSSFVNSQKKKLLQWWDQRESFLERDKVVKDIRKVCGTKKEEYAQYTKLKYRKLEKLQVYGIFNIPYYIDTIEEDNNPVIFCDFIRMVDRYEYHEIGATSDVVKNTQKADSKYPTKEAKLEFISKWWEVNKSRYENLPDLYREINLRIEKIKLPDRVSTL